ncbi:MAG: GIY-YIG nuclease family protein [Thermodesulfobacteriota bacterium]
MPSKRDNYRYELRDKGSLVYVGITNDPEKREQEHKGERKRFTSMNIITPPVTQDSAERWEEKRLETYRTNHQGKNPRYNKTGI